VDISPVGEEDLPGLSRLYEQFWGEPSDVGDMLSVLRRLERNPDYVLLAARRDGILLGSALGIVCHELYGDCSPFMVVEDFVVDQGGQRQGVGTLLMVELERVAASRDCTQIILVTESDRTGAVSFYESLGYESTPYSGFKKRLACD